MEKAVNALFQRYQQFFRDALKGEADLDQVASSYAAAFVAATPAGVHAGRNDAQLRQIMHEGFEHYRRIGTRDMRLRQLRIDRIDEHHCIAHAGWTASYARGTQADVHIDFEVHYLVQQLEAEPRIFGWISGDEQALLRQHGIV